MVILESSDYIDLRGHNGRLFNVILTYEKRSKKENGEYRFYFSTPMYAINWGKHDPIPDDVLSQYKKRELPRILKFVENIRQS